MLVTLIAAFLTAPGEPPAQRELFAREGFYRDQKGKEQEYTGILRYKPLPADVAIIGRYNAFTLEMEVGGKKEIREVYASSKPDLLVPYANRTVRITGKPVELEVVGKIHREIWPARIALQAK